MRCAVSPKSLWLFTIGLAIGCWALLVVAFLDVNNQVHATSSDITSSFNLLGIPLVEGYRVGGRLGLKFGWGFAVLLLGPFFVGMVAAMWQITRYAQSHRTQTFDEES
jgi:hypothetical protein